MDEWIGWRMDGLVRESMGEWIMGGYMNKLETDE